MVRRLKAEVNNARLSFIRPKNGLNTEKRQEQVIISLASYKARYSILPKTLKSILWQTYKPDRIYVWLDSDVPKNQLTPEMKEFERYGVTFRFTDDDLKPHKKYYYVMQEFPDAVIITFDDDIIYGRKVVERLVKKHFKYPDAICAGRVHRITWDKQGHIKPYRQWIWDCDMGNKPCFDLFATGCAGVLYPPGALPGKAFSAEKIRELCLYADDIWLKFMELAAKIPVVHVMNVTMCGIEESNETALGNENVIGNRNDIYISQMIEHYPKEFEFLKSNIL